MRPSYRILPQAWVDLKEILGHIATDNPDAAFRFKAAAEYTFALLATQPRAAPLHKKAKAPNAKGARVKPISGFHSYLVIYEETGQRSIDVIGAMHGSRDISILLGSYGEGFNSR
jgi:plasmid stabilization system protein ParE